MAQTLKTDLRNNIIKASKEEFLKYGYKDASLRRIAKSAGMTVGNLYRYYKNKEDIMDSIVSDTRRSILNTIRNLTSNSVSLEARVYNVTYDIRHFKKMLDTLADRLVDIYFDSSFEFNILLKDEDVKNEFLNWLTDLLKYIIMQNYTVSEYEKSVDLLAKAYANSMYSGMEVLFFRTGTTKESLKNMLTIFFRGYVAILDADISRLIGN